MHRFPRRSIDLEIAGGYPSDQVDCQRWNAGTWWISLQQELRCGHQGISLMLGAMLINAILMGIYSLWVSIFVNYVWCADYEYKKSPYIARDSTCAPNEYGGLGLKNLECRNDACMVKLVWAVAIKKDIMWVNWVHGHYLKHVNWWSYKPGQDVCWY
ncbi:hypothetical protein Cgig2_029712 [Carnegiea gigantea]|uniref:Uncharacterized protein n=1 Tax=Carnegiea gigantea TaxID=171969 RepID=A0A9Q1GS06_9CARY|nr:hypothetical protein Cgig2_029712 [Carnegiea gigantea]